MNFSQISAWSIRNPVVPIVLFLALTLAGIMSFMGMEVQNDPDIEFPVVVVSISQPGAAPSEITTQITQKVESAIRSVQGVRNIDASASEGNTTVSAEFEIGDDINAAVSEVKNAVDQIRSDLPDGILEPQIFKVATSSDPIAYFAVEASDMTLEQLSWFVDDTVARRLLAVEGMASVSRNGGVNREIRVVLDPAKMQAMDVTAAQVNGVLRQQNLNAAGGQSEIAGSRQSVRVLGNADDAFALSQRQISLGGRTIKLADIAEVTDGYSEQTAMAFESGQQVVTFGMSRAKGASDVTVFDEAMLKMAEIEKENPGIKFTTLFNSVDYTKGQYKSSMAAMIEGALLAIVVVFLFLRDWRATVISAIAIPLSAIPTFWFLDLLGFTLNTMSLLALGLVAGVLVDDAIVEIENIVRHMRMGKSAYQASIDAADEIGLAVVATTFSIVAVFLPVGLMPGVAGQFFKNFGLTVVASVLMSLAVARMITPMIAAYFLKSGGVAEHGEGPMMDRYMKLLRWSLDSSKAVALKQMIERVRGRFWYYPLWLAIILLFIATFGMAIQAIWGMLGQAGLPAFVNVLLAFFGAAAITIGAVVFVRFLLGMVGGGFGRWYAYIGQRFRARWQDHRLWMMGLGFLSLLATIGLLIALPKQFFPTGNQDFSRVRIEMVPGTTLDQTRAVADQAAEIVESQPEVNTALISVREGSGSIFITLKKDRERTSQEFEQALTPRLSQIADARVSFQAFGPGGGGSGRDVSVMLSGSDPALLDKTAVTLVEQMKGLKEVRSPRIAADLQRPELIVTPRTDLAAQLGVTTAALSQTIRIATLGDIDQNSAKFSLSDRQIPIRVMLAKESRQSLDVIRNLPVQTASGGSVPLSRVADISFGSGPTTVQRRNQNFRIFVGADFAPGVVSSQADAVINKLPVMQNLPTGVSRAPFGSQEWEAEMQRDFLVALVSGTLLVFAVLVLLYHRFMSPLVNMGSLLLAPLGGLMALAIVQQPISMPVFIGVLMLFGIVAKNSILLIDFAIEEMARGVPKFQAIMEAGHKRAQPIVMTTVAMTAGMIPTAISLGGDGQWRAPMGTVVIGGLIVSTLLTLLIVPAGFSLADGLEKRMGPWLRTRLLTYDPEKHGEKEVATAKAGKTADGKGDLGGLQPAE
jgi:multidrug efflux pump subunit AcrB